jgi:hypothetical protein
VKTSARAKSIIAGLAVGALASAAPAAGSVAEPPTSTAGDSPAQLAQAQNAGQPTDITVRRAGDQAVPFVAELSRPQSATGAGDAFDWGAAAIGAGVALFTAALLMAGVSTLGGRRREGKRAAPMSQGA